MAEESSKERSEIEEKQKQSQEQSIREETPVSECIYQLKWIPWRKDFVPIITQNENGPCPLLALCNVLILSSLLYINPGQTIITSQELINLLGSCLVRCKPKNLVESELSNYEQNMQDAIAMFPRLLTGLDVNVKYDSVSGFEFTQELAIFDLLGVQLYHGWLPDPSDVSTHTLVSPLTYNQLVEQAINDSTSDDSNKVNAALILHEFLEATATQLTYHGLCELNCVIREGQFCVFFRNNHFNTMLKRNNELLLLVTDYGFLNEHGHVWHVLSDIDDSGDFLDTNFELSTVTTITTSNTTNTAASTAHYTPTTPSTDLYLGDEKTQEHTNLDEEIAIGLIAAEDSEHHGLPASSGGASSNVASRQQPTEPMNAVQHLTDEELALQLHNEEMNRIQQATQQGLPLSQPNTREEYEQLALREERERRANNKPCCLM